MSVSILNLVSDLNILRLQKSFSIAHGPEDDLSGLIEVDLVPRKIDSHVDYLNPQQDVSGYTYFNFYNYMPRTYDYIRDEAVLEQSRSNIAQTKNHWLVALTIHKEVRTKANVESQKETQLHALSDQPIIVLRRKSSQMISNYSTENTSGFELKVSLQLHLTSALG